METVNITRTEVLKSGTRGNKPWTLYRVHGTHADGTSLGECKTFDALGVGKQQVHISPDDRDPNGIVLSVKPPKRTPTVRPGTPRPAFEETGGAVPTNVEQRLADLEDRVEVLEDLLRRRTAERTATTV